MDVGEFRRHLSPDGPDRPLTSLNSLQSPDVERDADRDTVISLDYGDEEEVCGGDLVAFDGKFLTATGQKSSCSSLEGQALEDDRFNPAVEPRDVICHRPTCQLVNEDQPSSCRRSQPRFRTSDGLTHSGSRGVPAHFNAEWSRHSSQLRCHTDVEKGTSHDVMFVRRLSLIHI